MCSPSCRLSCLAARTFRGTRIVPAIVRSTATQRDHGGSTGTRTLDLRAKSPWLDKRSSAVELARQEPNPPSQRAPTALRCDKMPPCSLRATSRSSPCSPCSRPRLRRGLRVAARGSGRSVALRCGRWPRRRAGEGRTGCLRRGLRAPGWVERRSAMERRARVMGVRLAAGPLPRPCRGNCGRWTAPRRVMRRGWSLAFLPKRRAKCTQPLTDICPAEPVTVAFSRWSSTSKSFQARARAVRPAAASRRRLSAGTRGRAKRHRKHRGYVVGHE